MKTSENVNELKYRVAAFYEFLPIHDQGINLIKEELNCFASKQEIKGTILLASEGVNGTVCGYENSISLFLQKLKQLLKISEINVKYSWSHKQAFRRFKARKKKEIVTLGIKNVKPSESERCLDTRNLIHNVCMPSTIILCRNTKNSVPSNPMFFRLQF